MVFLICLLSVPAESQVRTEAAAETEAPLVLSLEQALKIALSENLSVRIADEEIRKQEYAEKGSYSALFPQVSGTGSFQRTIKKQVMYFDMDMGSMFPGGKPGTEGSGAGTSGGTAGDRPAGKRPSDGIEVGRWNTYDFGVTATLPLVNVQLWESLRISGRNVDLAVEKARESRLEMVTQVKQAYYAVLLAKEVFSVYRGVYENAVDSYRQTEMKFNAQKASELDLVRARSNMANAVPNVYNAENSVMLALWQLKAVIGMDLDRHIDVAGSLEDCAGTLFREIQEHADRPLTDNSTLRQLAIQAEQLALKIKADRLAYAPSLGMNFKYSYNAMANDFDFSEYRWTPHAFVGFSLSIPIFSGGKRYNDLRQSKVQLGQLELQRADAERKLKIAVRQSLSTMETDMKSHASADEAVRLARKAYDIAARSYQTGKSTLTDLNAAQLALTQAQLAGTQAVYDFMVAKAGLEKTLGCDFLEEEGRTE